MIFCDFYGVVGGGCFRFGDDFKFADAARQFNNMDPLIHYINSQWVDDRALSCK